MYVFSKKQYTACENGDYEEGFGKICLYGKSTNEITHASRQITFGKDKGKWTSKLGTQFTINHGTAYFIESQEYGEVIQFMKRQWP